MESGLVSILGVLFDRGILTTFSIELTTLVAIYYLYKLVLKPMLVKVEKIPTLEEIKETVTTAAAPEDIHFEEIAKRLEKLMEELDKHFDEEITNSRDIADIKRDIEYIKQILNQFQGHMMYSSGDRRSSDFGNRELK
jgi:hypothetical protein